MDALTSPLLRARAAPPPESSVTDNEVAALVALARSRGAQTLAIGSGRTPPARDAARTVAAAWEHAGGDIALEITWPETAASWLRQATRFAAAQADLWIMLGPPLGWAQMTRRLLWSTPWDPARAVLAAAVSDTRALDLVGRHNLPGISGVTRDGHPWHLDADDQIVPRTKT
ncbi:ABC transporter substrate-binding protein [Actinomadura rupiterrae]|uniref:ABC transporter substrate-binding protein n=1 Tax=Actinomadura rupiterrae TaxID=559627 RepID=UPI0020A342BB|nr:ABC transporter substrate-binding protein [Actinomadura rupiterrae]MCP2342222.1 hypothetical protein [Actinomadura rupiterrae]